MSFCCLGTPEIFEAKIPVALLSKSPAYSFFMSFEGSVKY